jgi:flagellar basal-body rod protein FlgG
MKEIYQVMSAAMGEETRLNLIANNLANVDTAGFKQDRLVFNDFFKLEAAEAGQPMEANPALPAMPDYTRGYTDFAVGPAIPTGRPLDLMIDGEGYFEIEDANGVNKLYTRAGNFTIDDRNQLVTPDGRRVLDGTGSGIVIDPIQGEPKVMANGEIRVGGELVATLRVVSFSDPEQLIKFGDSLFRATPEAAPTVNDEARIRAGALEGSNVQPLQEIVRMIEAQRAYQAHQKVIQAIDQTLESRIRQILTG